MTTHPVCFCPAPTIGILCERAALPPRFPEHTVTQDDNLVTCSHCRRFVGAADRATWQLWHYNAKLAHAEKPTVVTATALRSCTRQLCSAVARELEDLARRAGVAQAYCDKLLKKQAELTTQLKAPPAAWLQPDEPRSQP